MLENKRQTGNKLSNKTNFSINQLKQLKFNGAFCSLPIIINIMDQLCSIAPIIF